MANQGKLITQSGQKLTADNQPRLSLNQWAILKKKDTL